MSSRRRALARLRGERLLLPRVRPFLPLLLRSLVTRRRGRRRAPGARPLTTRVGRLARDGVVLQLQPADPDETVGLAAGCRGSARRILVHWPEDADEDAFERWHRHVIKAGALDRVDVARSVDVGDTRVRLVHRGA